ncbi:MAG: hypothetical protein WC135_06875, partial [Bacteroidales bacterium]
YDLSFFCGRNKVNQNRLNLQKFSLYFYIIEKVLSDNNEYLLQNGSKVKLRRLKTLKSLMTLMTLNLRPGTLDLGH